MCGCPGDITDYLRFYPCIKIMKEYVQYEMRATGDGLYIFSLDVFLICCSASLRFPLCFNVELTPCTCVCCVVVIYRGQHTVERGTARGMLTYYPDPLPPVVCLMEEDVPPNPFCSAPPHSEPPPPLPSLSSTTPRYSFQHLFFPFPVFVYYPTPAYYSAELSPSIRSNIAIIQSSSFIQLLSQPEEPELKST